MFTIQTTDKESSTDREMPPSGAEKEENNSNNLVNNPPSAQTMDDCLEARPSNLLGRTQSASAVDCRRVWRNKNSSGKQQSASQSPFCSSEPSAWCQIGVKRKFSSQEYNNNRRLPTFTSSIQSDANPRVPRPTPTTPVVGPSVSSPEFITPTSQPKKQLSRPNSPSNASTRPVLPRTRVASIRRESDCSVENEAAHEKMMKSAQQVSMGFEDFCLDEKLFEERKRAKSLTEPISIFTNAFLLQSSSPSPTRANMDTQKQCYSPSTQQLVRSNISYSPSPSPTPGSPYNRMRSMSPIAVRQISKRRYTGGNGSNENGSGLESDGESSANSSLAAPPAPKRQCTTPRSVANASPLVRDSTLSLQQQNQIHFTATSLAEPAISISDIFAASSPTYSNTLLAGNSNPLRPRLLVDPRLAAHFSNSSLDGQEEDREIMMTEEDVQQEEGPLMSSFCSGSVCNDANSSTTFSSRANTPHSEMLDNSGNENDNFLPPPLSVGSSGTSSQCSSLKALANDSPSSSQQQHLERSPKMQPSFGFGLIPARAVTVREREVGGAGQDKGGEEEEIRREEK